MKKYLKVTAALLVALPFPFTRLAIAEPITATSWHFDDPAAYQYNVEEVAVAQSQASLRPVENWFGNGWKYRRALYVAETTGADLSQFQTEITLTEANFEFSHAQPDGADIRFTAADGLTPLNHWIEDYDAQNERAAVSVKIPELPAGNPQSVYLYYGNSAAPSTSSWDQTFGSGVPAPAITTIYSNGEYNAFPTLVQLHTGELIASFRQGSAHVSPDGRIALARSTDGGQTWAATTMYDDPTIDDRVDLGLTELSDGTLIQPFYQYAAQRVTGAFILKSADGGQSWGEPIPIANPLADWLAVYGQVVELDDGTLLLPAYGTDRSVLLQSADRGNTWSLRSTIALDYGRRYNETTVIRLNNGDLLAVMRTGTTPARLYQTISDNQGLTWLPPTYVANGISPNLTQLNAGTLLLMYGDRDGITGIRAQASQDGGASWRPPVTFDRGNALATDHGYPSAVALDKETVLAMYYKDLDLRMVKLTADQVRASENADNLFDGFEAGSLQDWQLINSDNVIRRTANDKHDGQSGLELIDTNTVNSPQASRPIYSFEHQTGAVSVWVKVASAPNGVEFGLLDGGDPSLDKRFWVRIGPQGQLTYQYSPRYSMECDAWAPLETPASVELNRWNKFTLRFQTAAGVAEVFINGESLGLIGGCAQDDTVSYFAVATSSAEGTGDRVFIDDLYTQQFAETTPEVLIDTEYTHYPVNAPSIMPEDSTSNPVTALESFQEQANKNGGEITYQLSPDGGTAWFWWSGANWQSTAGGAQESTTAAVVNAHAASFPATGGPMLFRAFLHSDGSQLVKLDAVNIRYLSD